MVSIYVLLIVFLITLLAAAAVGRSWFHRRLRRPESLRHISLIVLGTLLVTNLACFILGAPELWRTANLTATLGGLAALGIVMTALRTGGVPAPSPAAYWPLAPTRTTSNWPAAGPWPSSLTPDTRSRDWS